MYKNLDVPLLSYSTDDFQCAFNVHSSYEIRTVDVDGISSEALCYLPGTTGFIMWQQNQNGEMVLLTGKKYDQYFNDITKRLETEYNFNYNCHGLSFLNSNLWLEDLNFVNEIINNCYNQIHEEDLNNDDVIVFYCGNEIVHSCKKIEGGFVTKNGVLRESNLTRLEDLINKYRSNELRFFRRK